MNCRAKHVQKRDFSFMEQVETGMSKQEELHFLGAFGGTAKGGCCVTTLILGASQGFLKGLISAL